MSRPNLLSLFDEFCRYSNEVAIVQQRGYRRESWTYSKVLMAATARAQRLQQIGVRTGDRVLLCGPNSAEWVAVFWGCLIRGAVVVALDESSTPEFVARVVADSGAKAAFLARTHPPLSTAMPTFFLEDFPCTPEGSLQSSESANIKAAVHPAASTLADEPISRDHVAQILFTSGTTSEPRGVVLTHGNFLANLEPLENGIEEYRKYEWWVHPLRFISLVPMSHVFGQFMSLFVPPLLGAAVVFENSPQPSQIQRTIKSERATALVAVPRMMDAVRNALEQEIEARGWRAWFTKACTAATGEGFLGRAWRFRRLHGMFGWKFWAFISGGASLSPDTESFFKRIGYAVVQGYGMTETASLISLNHPFRAAEGSVGQVLPGREFRLAEDGEILVRGENVSSAYWQAGAMRDATKENGGWLRTGDLGELDTEGNLRFRGRKKNVIVTPAGLNIYPEDLEAALRKQPAIRDAVAISIESGGNAEPCAILLLSGTAIPGSASPADSLPQSAVDAANTSLSEHQRIRRWLLWPDPDFPRTPTGKPRLAAITDRAKQLLKSPDASTSRSSPFDTSLTSIASLPSSLKDLSSLDRVELLSVLERRYNIELNETQFANAQTAADLQKLLTQPSAHRSDYVYPRWTQLSPIRFVRLAVYYALTWPATLFLGHPKILGRKNLATLRSPALFVANHTTRRADIGLILFALPARFRHRLATAMGGETLRDFRHPPREWLLAKRWLWKLNYFLVVSLFNVFPLPQLSGFRESFRFAGESADRGYSILVFPEGIINDRDTPEMIAFQQGIGLLAQNLQIPIVPMRLDGVWQMKQERRRLAQPNEITIHIGTPLTFPSDTPPAEIVAQLESSVRTL